MSSSRAPTHHGNSSMLQQYIGESLVQIYSNLKGSDAPKYLLNLVQGHKGLTPNACWLLKIRCVVGRIFARCEYGYDLAYGPGVVSA